MSEAGHHPAHGKNTILAVENFDVSGEPVHRRVIQALLAVKRAAAFRNAAAGAIGIDQARAIAAVCDQLEQRPSAELFPVDVFQTGSGTSTNMNVNEVVAHFAGERLGAEVHPNDHVNASQSTNDVFPSAVRIAALAATTEVLLPGLTRLERELGLRARELAGVVKAGRTHLMDATPVTLGQELGGHAAQVREARERIDGCLARVGRLPLGGTATGTGLNAPEGFGAGVVAQLAVETGLPLSPAPNRFATQGAHDALVELSSHVRTAAVALYKIANDVRLLASGPRTGLHEIRLPELQPGSSIMPGKTNPVICEVVAQVAAQVIGNDAAVAFAGSQGHLELNANIPVIARNLLSSIELLGRAAGSLATQCIAGIEADVERCRALAEATLSTATGLNPILGYDTTTELVREALDSDRSLAEVIAERGLDDTPGVREALDVEALAGPTRPDDVAPDIPPEDV